MRSDLRVSRWRRAPIALVAVIALVIGAAGLALAATIDWDGQGTTDGACSTVYDVTDPTSPALPSGITLNPGEQLWQFNLTSVESLILADTALNATFDPSPTVTNQVADVLDGGVAKWFVLTPAGAILTSADAREGSESRPPSQLTISHCWVNPTVTTPAADLTITKDASGSYDNTYTWTIEKDVDKTVVKTAAATATFNYTVTVEHGVAVVSNVQVTGTITVTNPNDADVEIDDVTDELSDGTDCTVTVDTTTIPANGFHEFAYECDLGDTLPEADLTNTATVSWSDQTLEDGSELEAGSADVPAPVAVTFTGNDVDECVDVTDTFDGDEASLGTLCVGDTNPSEFEYSHTVAVPRNDCATYDNTAEFTTNDTKATDDASQSVEVCGPVTGGLTIGYWQNKNGQAQIKGAGPSTGTCSLTPYLRGFAPYADLSATATCSGVATYVTNVIKAANAGGSTMNAMLKAQMLATALDAYFGPLGAGVYVDLTMVPKPIGSATYENTSAAFGGGTCQTVSALLSYAASQSDSGGSTWYGNVKATQELAKDTFDAINNQAVFAC